MCVHVRVQHPPACVHVRVQHSQALAALPSSAPVSFTKAHRAAPSCCACAHVSFSPPGGPQLMPLGISNNRNNKRARDASSGLSAQHQTCGCAGRGSLASLAWSPAHVWGGHRWVPGFLGRGARPVSGVVQMPAARPVPGVAVGGSLASLAGGPSAGPQKETRALQPCSWGGHV